MRNKQKSRLKTFFFLFLIGSGAFILRLLPTISAYLKRGEKVFLGINSLYNLSDIFVYWAEMMMGQKGNFLLLKEFGLDPQELFFIRLPYVYLGHLARILGLKIEVVYFLSAYFLVILLAVVLFYFSSLFFKKYLWRLLTVGLILLSGPPLIDLPPEAVPFFSFLEPHFILVHICLVLIFYFFLNDDLLNLKEKKIRTVLAIFLTGLILSLVHAFMNWLVIMVLFFWIVVFFRLEKERKKLFFFLFLLIISSLPMTLYLFFLSKNSPFFSYWLNKNILPFTHPVFCLSRLGVFLFLIPFSLKLARKNKGIFLLIVWFLAQPLFTSLPFGWRRRLIEGWWITAALLAALGIFYLWQKWKLKLIFVIFPFFFIGIFNLLLTETPHLLVPEYLVYVSPKEAEVWEFLLPRCDFSQTVFTDYPRGIYLPAKTGCRSNIGHSHLTFNFSQRLVEVEKIISGEIELENLEKFFQEKEISYLFLPREKAENAGLSHLKNLRLVFGNEEFLLYKKI